VLKLVRRPVTEFLGAEQRRALEERVTSSETLAANTSLTSLEKSKRIRAQWDNFRAGRTSRGTFEALWHELLAMGFDKCAFCETPAPGTVEHREETSQTPSKAFTWENLFPACDPCNRNRENSGVTTQPLDPSAVEPLDYFGWDEYGDFAPAPLHQNAIDDLVKMYGLHRFREERCRTLKVLRAILSALITEDATKRETVDALRAILTGTSAWLGPVREYLLRPPNDEDALLVQGALRIMPEMKTLVEPWLRPPSWAPPWWR
jgi:5-methylcytosine-specific restriction endonuclease McrA